MKLTATGGVELHSSQAFFNPRAGTPWVMRVTEVENRPNYGEKTMRIDSGLWLLGGLLFLFSACSTGESDAGDEPDILVDDYDRSCSDKSDCEAVYDGSACKVSCGEPVGINKEDGQAFREEKDRLYEEECDGRGFCFNASKIEVECESGTCRAWYQNSQDRDAGEESDGAYRVAPDSASGSD